MTYDELMAAVDLLAMEDPEEAKHMRNYFTSERDSGTSLLFESRKLLAYLPPSSKAPSGAGFGSDRLMRVNWTPPKP